MDKKICPFMNSRTTVEPMPLLVCQEEKCMAWGRIPWESGKDVGNCYGCKLIERRSNQ